jgi:hypothetical protein
VLPIAAFQLIVVTPALCESWTPASTSSGTGFPTPAQTPLPHISFVVQTLASSHAVPSVLGGFEQLPVPESHVPAS